MSTGLRNFSSFEGFIGEREGAFRDINFANPSWNGFRRLVDHFAQKYPQVSVADKDGSLNEVLSSVVTDAARKPGGLLVSYKSSEGWISEFQVFFGTEDDHSPYVEISFHPNDVIHSDDTRHAFLAWTDEVKLLLQADSYSYG
ncbi:MAG: hypothetical protein AAF718_10775 [Pseudomonadota bacterium]